MIPDHRAFILDHTRLQSPPHAPELTLHLASEIEPIWRQTEAELQTQGLEPPFWAFAWAGGQALARYLLDHPEEVRGRRVLDFATGSGLVAIAAMKAGARSALAADIDPFCRAAVALNAQANGVEVAFVGEDLLEGAPPDVEIICAGDICYAWPLADRVRRWLEAADAAGVRVLIGDPGRAYLPREGLKPLASYEVQTTRELEDREIRRTGVFTFTSGLAIEQR
ncbi:MAG TPA: methyltransferase [Caulobacteraceae bacterium]